MSAEEPAAGTVDAIFVFPVKRQPGEAREQVIAVSGTGLEGDHTRGGARSVTLLAREAWEETMAELGADLPPEARRANLYVRGLDLPALIGRRLRIGAAELTVAGETTPCQLMEDEKPGLLAALEPKMRGGVFGPVETTGSIRCGDSITVLD